MYLVIYLMSVKKKKKNENIELEWNENVKLMYLDRWYLIKFFGIGIILFWFNVKDL